MRGFPVLIVLALMASAGQARAQYVYSKAVLQGDVSIFGAYGLTDGGPGAPSASVATQGFLDGLYLDSDVTASASATAQGGHIDLDLSIATTVDAGAPSQHGTAVIGRADMADSFRIEAGSSGLANGDPVQVELQVEIDGWVSLGGAASSDGSFYSFRVTDRATSGNQAELEQTSIPPGSFSVDPPRWYVTLDTAIGRTLILDTFLTAQIGSQDYGAGAESTDRMWFDADVRILPASGYPDIEIISEAGAPIGGLNQPPVADISVITGVPAHGGDVVQLDGSASSDPDGGDLTYEWTLLETPPGSSATLTGADTASPSFVPDELGSYQIQLIVDDDEGTESEPALLTLTVENQPPVAAFTVLTPLPYQLGVPIELDARDSFDPDGDDLDFFWTLLGMPPGSSAALTDTDPALPSLVPDEPGSYQIQLIVVDEFLASSEPVLLTLTVENQPPTAIITTPTPLIVHVGTPVEIDGSTSFDPDGDVISYHWAMILRPEGSTALPIGGALASLTPDRVGSYTVQLVVRDEFGALSHSVGFAIIADNQPPTAHFTPSTPLTVHVGTPVEFDASTSFDPDGDEITHAWTLTLRPEGSTAVLFGGALTPDKVGTYSGELTVYDEFGATSPAAPFTLEAYNMTPVASAGADRVVVLGEIVTLDGSESGDPDDDPLSYAWTLTNPDGSLGTLSDVDTVTPWFTAESLGDYVATLVVSDPWDEESTPDSVTVSVAPPDPEDIDGDGVPNAEDNCPLDANEDQVDWNGDGYGDLCTLDHCVTDSAELQAALDEASANDSNDVIQLVEGIYGVSGNGGEQFDYFSSEAFALVMRGGYGPGCAERFADPSRTVLDGEGSSRVLSLTNEGLALPFADLVVERITVRGGFASESAGIYVRSRSGARVVLEGNLIRGNRADYDSGVLVDAERGSVLLRNNMIVDNVAEEALAGVGVLVWEGGIELINNTIAGNAAPSGQALGISASGATEVHLRNNIVWGNTATEGFVAEIYIHLDATSHAYASYNDWDPDQVSAAFTSESGNIAEDPLFAHPGWNQLDDYGLSAGSPCVDAIPVAPGWPDGFPPTDIEGDPRPLDGDGDGEEAADIGADEYAGDTQEPPACGDGVLASDPGTGDPLEECDDGNVDSGDGCDARCVVEEGFTCTGEPSFCEWMWTLPSNECEDGIDNDGDGRIDFDGGASAGLPPEEQTDPDRQCFAEWADWEGPSYSDPDDPTCGLGAELTLLLPPLIWLWGRRRRCS